MRKSRPVDSSKNMVLVNSVDRQPQVRSLFPRLDLCATTIIRDNNQEVRPALPIQKRNLEFILGHEIKNNALRSGRKEERGASLMRVLFENQNASSFGNAPALRQQRNKVSAFSCQKSIFSLDARRQISTKQPRKSLFFNGFRSVFVSFN